MANNKLQMPADYVALNESEMSCVEGGGVVSQVFYAFGKMFSGVYYDHQESELKSWKKITEALYPRRTASTRSLTDMFTK